MVFINNKTEDDSGSCLSTNKNLKYICNSKLDIIKLRLEKTSCNTDSLNRYNNVFSLQSKKNNSS